MAGAQIHGRKLLGVSVQGQTKNLLVLRCDGFMRLFGAHPLVEGFNAEYGTSLTVVSHKVADVAQTVGDTWMSLPGYVVDASIAYEKPGTKLGKEIVFATGNEPRVVLATGKFNGERDVALVALEVTSADFQNDGNSIVLNIPEDRLIVVPNFPGSSGWYMSHAETGVSHGREVEQSPGARYLSRRDDSSYVGLLARNGYYHDWRQRVLADYEVSTNLGAVAEVPDADVAKIEALLTPVATPQPSK